MQILPLLIVKSDYFILITVRPIMQIIMPTILFHVSTSLYANIPTNKSIIVNMALCTIEVILTCQPALYAYINPVSSPTTDMPSNHDDQLSRPISFTMSVCLFVSKHITKENTAPTRYVTVKDTKGFAASGTLFVHIWYITLDSTTKTMGHIKLNIKFHFILCIDWHQYCVFKKCNHLSSTDFANISSLRSIRSFVSIAFSKLSIPHRSRAAPSLSFA